MNLDLLLSKPEARIDPDAVRGYLESSILEKVISGMEDLEAKADDCKKVATTVLATIIIMYHEKFYQFLATSSHWPKICDANFFLSSVVNDCMHRGKDL